MKIGIAGLGKMGGRMAEKLVKEGQDVVVWNRTHEKAVALADKLQGSQNIKVADSIEDLVRAIPAPRVVLTMLPAGDATEELLSEVAKLLQKDDIVPILDSLAKSKGGHEYFGEGGAGHFVKMVHNGIEYPIMQALGEGFGVMANSEYNFDLVKVAKLYQKGTLVSGFMLDRAVEALESDPRLERIEGVIGSASKETVWTIEEAKKNDLPIESIEQAQEFRVRSESDQKIQNSFAAHMVGALRITFGGHPVKLKDNQNNK
jgi:6-phosphogluconate dehydrogenase